MVLRSGGWQANVEYFEDYVIKTPKTEGEIRETVSKYLKHIGKIEELDERVFNMQNDWQVGLKIVRSGKILSDMLGDLEFLEENKIKQRRVEVLQDAWDRLYSEGKVDEMNQLVDKSLDFVIELWRYRVFDKTFKIGYEYGVIGGKVILIDFGELSEEKSILEKGILKKKWVGKMNEYSHPDVAKYFNCQAEKKWTLKILNENWGRYLK